MTPLRVLSLGWGIQSFTLAAMAALGEMPPLDAAISADTTHERQATYRFAEKWTPWLAERGVSVRIAGGDPAKASPFAWHKVQIPALTSRGGQVKRQCSTMWKIRPIRQQVRALMVERGIKARPGVVEQWIGFSLDEFERMRDSDVRYIANRWPLVERRMTRGDCAAWLAAHGLPIPPKSACTFCPYQTRASWAELKRAGGADWAEAVAVDAEIRERRFKNGDALYLHPALMPLPQAVDIPEDHGYVQGDLFAGCPGGVCFT